MQQDKDRLGYNSKMRMRMYAIKLAEREVLGQGKTG